MGHFTHCVKERHLLLLLLRPRLPFVRLLAFPFLHLAQGTLQSTAQARCRLVLILIVLAGQCRQTIELALLEWGLTGVRRNSTSSQAATHQIPSKPTHHLILACLNVSTDQVIDRNGSSARSPVSNVSVLSWCREERSLLLGKIKAKTVIKRKIEPPVVKLQRQVSILTTRGIARSTLPLHVHVPSAIVQTEINAVSADSEIGLGLKRSIVTVVADGEQIVVATERRGTTAVSRKTADLGCRGGLRAGRVCGKIRCELELPPQFLKGKISHFGLIQAASTRVPTRAIQAGPRRRWR